MRRFSAAPGASPFGILRPLFAFRQGFGSLCQSAPKIRTVCRPYIRASVGTIRLAPIRVVRVVVEVTARVHIPHVVRIASIGRPQPNVHRRTDSLRPYVTVTASRNGQHRSLSTPEAVCALPLSFRSSISSAYSADGIPASRFRYKPSSRHTAGLLLLPDCTA